MKINYSNPIKNIQILTYKLFFIDFEIIIRKICLFAFIFYKKLKTYG